MEEGEEEEGAEADFLAAHPPTSQVIWGCRSTVLMLPGFRLFSQTGVRCRRLLTNVVTVVLKSTCGNMKGKPKTDRK